MSSELSALLLKLVLALVGGALTLVGLAGVIQGSLRALLVPNRTVAIIVLVVGLALVTIFGEPDLISKITATASAQ